MRFSKTGWIAGDRWTRNVELLLKVNFTYFQRLGLLFCNRPGECALLAISAPAALDLGGEQMARHSGAIWH
jgi:hypothetical protein